MSHHWTLCQSCGCTMAHCVCDSGYVAANVVSLKPAPVNVDLRMGVSNPSDTILENAKGKLKGVLVVGYGTDGRIYTDCNIDDGGQVLWLVEKIKHTLMTGEK